MSSTCLSVAGHQSRDSQMQEGVDTDEWADRMTALDIAEAEP